MPQMMPINWIFFFFFFICIFLLFNVMNYYIFYNINLKSNKNFFKKKNFFNWKW
uniref:ATP synthase F0 subunit 8 n=1 Tax=Cepora nadina TaxID=1229496 RepID=UPI00237A95E2|nr:ATP synthase F0 subunit 8 [Cepora nadina]WBV74613.1 ATP synthase F0 subunit 8 [Cepora nadina]